MKLEYNTQQEPIVLKEYGRCVQKLLNHIRQEPERGRRTDLVLELMRVIELLASSPKELAENKERIWDDLFTIADFDLDIESLFPVPDREAAFKRPLRMSYPPARKFSRYGRNINKLFEVVVAKEDPQEREQGTIYMGRLLNTFHSSWNNSTADNALLLKDLAAHSDNQLKLDPERVERENLFERLFHEKKRGPYASTPSSQGNGGHRKDHKKPPMRRYRRRVNGV